MSSEEKMRAILQKLVDRSSKGEIPWKETASEHSFLFSQPRLSYTVYRLSEWRHGLMVNDEEGKFLDSLDSNNSPAEGDRLEALFEMARRKARNVDERLEQALREL